MDLIVDNLPPKDQTIGVVVSGGFDSSLLWHIIYGICLERKQKVIPFTVPKIDGALTYSTRMLKWSSKFYGTKQIHPFVIDPGIDQSPAQPYIGTEVAAQLLGAIKIIVDEGYADVVFTGVNAYPPNHETLCSYHTPGDRNIVKDNTDDYHGKPVNEWIKQPFTELTKDKIIKLADELNVLDPISELSHSCVEVIRGRCGECFWCKEREWGFSSTGHTDIGTN